ncbi:MAG TPA: helix-turn-helix domain-containing protein [Roseiflexaceae bacterium]|nr:helix-turn-helix domain-containing protein [Roseiflexaceae bacterium]
MNEICIVVLTHHLGQRIVDWLAISFDVGASVADLSAHIIASTDPDLVGRVHPVAQRAITSGALSEDHDTQFAGISIPIISASSIIGAIVLNDSSPRGRELASAAKALAELLIRQMTVLDPFARQRWVQAKFVYDLLHRQLDSSSTAVIQEAACLGIDLSIPRAVVLIDVKQVITQYTVRDSSDTILPLVTHMLRVERSHTDLIEHARRAIAMSDLDCYSIIDHRWLALLAVVDRTMVGGGQRLLDHDVQHFLNELTRSLGITTSAGIGHAYSSWPALAQSFIDARFALEMGTRLQGAGRVFRVEGLGLASFIGNDDQRMKQDLAQRLIQPVSAEPDLIVTLDVFLRAHLSPSVAAQILHIHRHTLTYRLAKIARLSGLDPRRFEDATQLYAALLLWNLNSGSCLGQMAKK